MVTLLPFIEQNALFEQFDREKGYADNLTAASHAIRTYRCVAATTDPNTPVTHYVALGGVGSDAPARPVGAPGNGFLGHDRSIKLADITDGTSNTIAIAEKRSGLGPWARGANATLRGFDPENLPWFGDDRQFAGHDGVCHVAMADGSVRSLKPTVDPKALAAAVTVNGAEENVCLD